MIELRTRLFVSLLVLLAAAPKASHQTASSGPSRSQAMVRKTGKTGNSRSSPARNSMAEASPVLCFQPGVGWQRILTGGANPPSADASSLSAKQAHSAQCPGILTDKKGLGAGVEALAILHPKRTIRSAGSAKTGAVTSLQVPPFHPNGSAGLKSMTTTPS